MKNIKSIFYIATLIFVAVIPITALILWIIAFEKAVIAIQLQYFIFLFSCPLIFAFFAFIFPIIRKITVNHFKRSETQNQIEFDLQMQKFQIEQKTLNEALKLLSPKQQEELTAWRLKKLKETEDNFNDENLLKTHKNKEIIQKNNA